MLRDCANAPPADHASGLPQDFYYQKAVDNLKASGIWQNNSSVKDWLETKWLCIPKVSPVHTPIYSYGYATELYLLPSFAQTVTQDCTPVSN